ncbi:6390_t:CDS:2 [Funneliformis geosporum]|uniref:6390_t:CDS:1 n=1 Tax=Funneliformis geosporum TaxID=1117311 RepID=A0A9W4SS09_9GLOM|nr:6390_t:CDS:2 [Funneliformis geosporum]
MSRSRIDYIWSSAEVVSHFTSCNVLDVDPSLSDHSLITFSVENFLDIRNNKRNIPSKKVYDYDKMTDDKWETFRIFWLIQ